jgi:hypothetical protein
MFTDKIPGELKRVQVDMFGFGLEKLQILSKDKIPGELERVQVDILWFGLEKIYMLWTWTNMKMS